MPTSISHLGGRARVNEPGRYKKKNNKNLTAQGLPTYIGMPQPLSNLIAKRVKSSQAISKKKGCFLKYPNSFSIIVGSWDNGDVLGFYKTAGNNALFGTLVPCGKSPADSTMYILFYSTAGAGSNQIVINFENDLGFTPSTTYNIKLTNANGDTALLPFTTDIEGNAGDTAFPYSAQMFNFVAGETIQVDWFEAPRIDSITVTTNNTASGAIQTQAGIGKRIYFTATFENAVIINNNGAGNVELPFYIDTDGYQRGATALIPGGGASTSITFEYAVSDLDPVGDIVSFASDDTPFNLVVNSPATLKEEGGTDFIASVPVFPAPTISIFAEYPQPGGFEAGSASASGSDAAIFISFEYAIGGAVDFVQGAVVDTDFTINSGSLTNNPQITSVEVVAPVGGSDKGIRLNLDADIVGIDVPAIICSMTLSTFADGAGNIPLSFVCNAAGGGTPPYQFLQ